MQLTSTKRKYFELYMLTVIPNKTSQKISIAFCLHTCANLYDYLSIVFTYGDKCKFKLMKIDKRINIFVFPPKKSHRFFFFFETSPIDLLLSL